MDDPSLGEAPFPATELRSDCPAAADVLGLVQNLDRDDGWPPLRELCAVGELPPGDADWKTAIRLVATSAHEALSRHRWAITLMQARTTPGPANLRHHDSVLGTFREAGFSIKQATHAFSVLDSNLFGFALQQLTMPFESSTELTEAAQSILDQFPADDCPHLAETITQHVTKSGYDYADEFKIGLDLILDGIERLRDTV